MIVVPNSRPHGADITNVSELAHDLEHQADHLQKMVEHIAKARQVKEWDSERRKACLSKAVAIALPESKGVAAAEHVARASAGYVEAMRLLQRDLYEAEKVLLDYETTKIKWETARSLLSVHKAMINEL